MSGNVTTNLVQAAYIIAAVLFVLSLAGLSKHEKAKEGNAFGVAGMVLALGATIWLSVDRADAPGASPSRSSRSPWRSVPRSGCGGPGSSR